MGYKCRFYRLCDGLIICMFDKIEKKKNQFKSKRKILFLLKTLF